MNKTDLFQELEGALLQGDVSSDLAEDALFTYVKKLEQIAWLEIVTIHCQEDSFDPGSRRQIRVETVIQCVRQSI